jgi:hypothetical protein
MAGLATAHEMKGISWTELDQRVEELNIIEARRNLDIAAAVRASGMLKDGEVNKAVTSWISLRDSITPTRLGSVNEFFSPRNRVKGAPVHRGKGKK